METSSLPVWAQAALMISISLVAAIVGVIKYLKTEQKTDVGTSSTASVISASFVDAKLLKELIEALREHQDELGRDSKRNQRLSQDLREAVNELNDSIIVQTDTTLNLVRFLNRAEAKRNSLQEGVR